MIENPIEIWGGIECTINRVGNKYFDQLDASGHYNRDGDLKMFADLGLKKMRYPILWEKHEPHLDTTIDWTFTEKQLNTLKQLNIEPIAGLVHHGSGPKFVHMCEDSFVTGLAAYAEKVALKFPWINYYTPVNEPLTTARFCGLYGIWYPHKKTDFSFFKILVNECKATVLAMQAIRKINPKAQLVQTEDLGKTHSTKLLKYQADFENERRWLSFDLLAGKVNTLHPLFHYILSVGITAAELNFFIENPCPPDILGLNHYLTSERYLDQNKKNYPRHTYGGNGRHRYADVEVLRVGNCNVNGPYQLFKEAWERYQIPLAVTEVHLHCTREDQMRWFKTVWDSVDKLSSEGILVKGITTWAMLGSFGWNKLLTQSKGDYEPGIFDVSYQNPRPTALCKMIQGLASGGSFDHPVLDGKGWWQRDIRIIYNKQSIVHLNQYRFSSSPILIIGKTGTLGNAFARLCDFRHLNYRLIGREEVNILSAESIENILIEIKPWAVINTAGFVRVDDAETDSENCYLVNAQAPKLLATACRKNNVKFLTYSSDLVFDGTKDHHYLEGDSVKPLNVYGHSKVLAEKYVLEANDKALIIRTSAFFGPWDKYNFVSHVLQSVKNKQTLTAAKDVFISPTYVPDLVNTSLDILLDDESGIWHMANRGSLSWSDFACEVARRSNCDINLINAVSVADLNYKAARPKFSALKSERGFLLPSLEDSLGRYFHEQNLIAV